MKIRLTLIVLTAIILGLISNYALSTLDDVYKKHLVKTYFNEFTPEFSEINQNTSKLPELLKNERFVEKNKIFENEYEQFFYLILLLRMVLILVIAYLTMLTIHKFYITTD